MKKMLLLGIAAVTLVAAAPAGAALNLEGPTGLIQVPTADTVAPMSVTVAADYINTDDMMVPIRAEVGLIEGLEVGGNYTWVDNDAIDAVFGANAKYALPLEVLEGLKIAVGGTYSSTQTSGDDLTQFGGYAVATYGLELEGIKLAASAGADFQKMEVGDFDESGIGFFGGVDVGVMEGLSVVAEFASDNGDIEDNTTGVAVRFAVPMVEGLTVQAGLSDMGDHEFFVGGQFALNFGN